MRPPIIKREKKTLNNNNKKKKRVGGGTLDFSQGATLRVSDQKQNRHKDIFIWASHVKILNQF